MAKEILHYFGFYSWTCEALITKIDELLGEEVTMRLNSPGGDLFSAVGVYAKIVEHGDVTMKVDGVAASAGFFATLYPKRVECLDVSRFMVHRADMYVNDPQQQLLLNDINKDHRKKLEARVDDAVFKEVTGITIADLFNPENRTDVWIDAKGMKKLGLVHKVNVLKTAEQKQMAQAMMEWSFDKPAAQNKPTPPTPKPTQTKEDMTIEKLQAEHPALYKSLIAKGKELGKKKEHTRVMAFMAFVAVDAKKVVEAIKSGEEFSTQTSAEFQAIAMSPEYLEKIKKTSAKAVVTGTTKDDGGEGADPTKAAATAELNAFADALDAELGHKKAAPKKEAQTVEA